MARVGRGSLIVLVGSVWSAGELAAQGNSSLSESKIEYAGANATAAALSSQNEEMRRQLAVQRESLKTLTESLAASNAERSEEHTSELQSRQYIVCRLLLEKKNIHNLDV